MVNPKTEKHKVYIVAVKSGTKSITRIEQHLVFETTKVFEVMPGFITEPDLTSCKTIAQLEVLCNKFASLQDAIAIVDGEQFNLVCEQSTIVHIINRSQLREGKCPICDYELVNNICLRCGLDWFNVTNDEIVKIAREYYKGTI